MPLLLLYCGVLVVWFVKQVWCSSSAVFVLQVVCVLLWSVGWMGCGLLHAGTGMQRGHACRTHAHGWVAWQVAPCLLAVLAARCSVVIAGAYPVAFALRMWLGFGLWAACISPAELHNCRVVPTQG